MKRKCPIDKSQLTRVTEPIHRIGSTYAKFECPRCRSTFLIDLDNGRASVIDGYENLDSFDRIAYA